MSCCQGRSLRPCWSNQSSTCDWNFFGLSFLIAAISSAVGIGNLWRFPYLVGTNGGGAFIFVYLLSLIAIVIPILIAEIMLGRMAEKGGHQSMVINAIQQKRSPAWGMLGWLFVLSCFITVAAFNLVDGYLTI